MKRIFASVLAFVMCIFLCSCANTNPDSIDIPSENKVSYFLTENSWAHALSSTGKGTLIFSEDGTGMYAQQNMTWEMVDETVSISYSRSDLFTGTYTAQELCEIVEHNGVAMLVFDDAIYVPTQGFSESCKTAREYMIHNAKKLDWHAAWDLSLDNMARANQEYNGLVQWTATVYDIDSNHCQMADEISSTGYPLNSILVFLNEEELARLNKHESYTVVGYLNVGMSMITGAFIVS